jgi:hypothetical protein
MSAPSLYYVDPNAGVDTTGGSAGTISAPWKTVQYALNHITRNTTSGDQINIKAGAADVLGATLSLVTYGTPNGTAPLIFRGYTSAAGDGGFGDIDGGAGNFSLLAAGTVAGIYFADLKLHNTGTARILTWGGGNGGGIYRCELYDSTGGGIGINNPSIPVFVFGCYFHDITGSAIDNGTGAQAVGFQVYFCTFKNGATRKFTDTIYCGIGAGPIQFNIFNLDGSSNGVRIIRGGVVAMFNDFYANGGTGAGLISNEGTNDYHVIVLNNYGEGFSGVSGKGFSTIAGSKQFLWGGNAAYNNATNFGLSGDKLLSLNSDLTLGASAFTNPAGGDFSVGTTLKALGLPTSFLGLSTNQYLDVGAGQRQETGGTSGPTYFSQ